MVRGESLCRRSNKASDWCEEQCWTKSQILSLLSIDDTRRDSNTTTTTMKMTNQDRNNKKMTTAKVSSSAMTQSLAPLTPRSTTTTIRNHHHKNYQHHHLHRISSSSSSSSSRHSSAFGVRNSANKINKMKTNINNKQINYNKPIYSSKIAFLAIVSFTTILLLTCLVNQQVSSLNCYSCSSADNPGCDESFSGRANITDTDCEKHIGRQAKVCRKIVQYLENKKVVIRSCGWIDEHDDKKPMCYKRSGTFALMMESCICYEDNCNHSASLVPNQSVLILLASCSMIFYYLMSKEDQRDTSH